LVVIMFLFASACSASSVEEVATPTIVAATEVPAEGTPPVSPQSHMQLAFATTDFGVGENRIAFGLIDSEDGPIRDATVEIQTFFISEGGQQDGPKETVNAVFRKWPISPSGIYTARLKLDSEGSWGIGVIASRPDGSVQSAASPIRVKAKSSAPQIGSAAPRSANKTLIDVQGLAQITTDVDPDPELYGLTVAEALDSGLPLMLTFSTPAFCQTATCGPQLDMLKALKAEYSDRANFIHIEVYDNPDEIQGDLSNAIVSPVLAEWRLPSEPWTFVVDEDGLVQAKFESFATREELETALTAVLP